MTLSKNQVSSRSRTLLTALLLSLPGAFVTGYAALSSHSSTQFADFIRRSMEVVSMFLSWWVFRQTQKEATPDEEKKKRLERGVNISVAVAMIGSGIVMVLIALVRLFSTQPTGKVAPGLIIAILGLLVNGGFWWRYAYLNREKFSAVIASQQKLYRAKAVVDLGVAVALAVVLFAATHPMAKYVDVIGSFVVAGYLFWSGSRLLYEIKNKNEHE